MEEDIKLIEPYNPTDPIVIFDPELERHHIVVPYINTQESEEENINGQGFGNQTKFDAIVIPLVQLNEMKLVDDQIETVEIKVEKLLPELYMKIYDFDNSISKLNSPGMTSTATVIMTAPVEGVNKKISLNFYINNLHVNTDGTIDMTGELNLPEFNQKKNEQIGSDKMSTYEFLKQIAQDTKLGFAATNKCAEVADARWRQIYSQTFKDYITEQLTYAGKDNESIFDAWVDQFGYLVMVNLSYVMGEKLEQNQLMMKIVKGSLFNDKADKVPEQKVEEVLRLITNARDVPGEMNAKFSKWENVLKNDLIKDEGTANKYFYMSSIGDENIISVENVDIVEPSADGEKNKDTYKFDKCEFIGFEMDDDSPILVQQKNVSRFKALMNYKQIFVEMVKPNYYLQRGTLVIVDFEDYDANTKKMTIMNNGNIAANAEEQKGEISVDDIIEDAPQVEDKKDLNDALLNNQAGVSNLALSGIYYINDMSFKYSKKMGGIMQCMHLVKRGKRNNIINESTPLVPYN